MPDTATASLAERARVALARWLFSPLQGMTFGDWWAVLRENRFRVAPRYVPRALLTTASSAVNSIQSRIERRLWGDRIAAAAVERPLFVLGHYRSGTTHLQNLLALDPRHVTIDNFRANFPWTFLTTERLGRRLGRPFTMRTRPHDGVALDLAMPAEDELALAILTGLSPHFAWHFPRRAAYYERFLTFEDASALERELWCEALRFVAHKLAAAAPGRTIVSKSPCHTARIPLLLEAFPDARFVHIHRDPYRVFQSTWNMERQVRPLFRFQRDDDDLTAAILRRYRITYRAYLADRERIPPGRLVELGYAELKRDPCGALRAIYERLDLGPFDVVRPRVDAYLASLGSYRTNRYPPLDPALRDAIAAAWRFAFEAWGYPLEPDERARHAASSSRSRSGVSTGAQGKGRLRSDAW